MRRLVIFSVILTLFTSIAVAQPRHGDLVLSVGLIQGTQGFTGFMNPGAPGTLTTLTTSPKWKMDNFVRMAPDNTDLVVGRYVWSTAPASGELVQIRPGGTQARVLATFWTETTDSFELDHDDQWIVTTRSNPTNPISNSLFGVNHTTGAITKFTSLVTTTSFNELVIDRDPGVNLPYTIVTAYPKGSPGPQILKADRQGTLTTIAAGSTTPGYLSIELHPRSGDYIACYGPDIIRMSKTGVKKAVLVTGFGGNGLKITQDDFVWIVNGTPVSSVQDGWVLKYDLSASAVVTMMPTNLPQNHFMTGVEIYGSRTLVCNQTSPSTVTVNVQSRHPQAGGKHYFLAASLARRPGMRMPNGEWLDLDVTCPLFYLSALGALPSIFQYFQGTLDPFGDAGAQVNIPALPSNLGIPVFVAGVIFDPKQGVIQVTNTHWFVL
jgi:hypothetical protein